MCGHCGYNNHTAEECHKHIVEEYLARQARLKAQTPKRAGGNNGKRGHRNGKEKNGTANLAIINNDDDDTSAPSYNNIFGGLTFCLQANTDAEKSDGVWIKDTGATHHMHHQKTLFSNYHRLKHKLHVGGITSGLKAVGVGNVTITNQNDNCCILRYVLHVPKLKSGLMSLNTLALVGLNSTIMKDGCVVMDGEFRIHSPIRNGLCVWNGGTMGAGSDVDAFHAAIKAKKPTLTDWHERLPHVSKNTLLQHGENAIAEFHVDVEEERSKDHQTPCESCVIGKHPRSLFPARTEWRQNALELVHSDPAEANVPSLRGGKYVLTFTDDATALGNVFILANKNTSIVLNAFKEYQA